jgi:hypothetical protein
MIDDLPALLGGTALGLVAVTVLLLGVFIGFCVLLGFPKLRATSKGSLVIKSLDERVGAQTPFHYLPPSSHGPIDALRTPELPAEPVRQSG